MSFSFRNIFSPEDGSDGGGAGKPHDPVNGPPRAGQKEALSGASQATGGRSQAFLVNEILPFIPPAIAAQSGIPMEQELQIPLPADGSTDVKLSTIFQTCPQLFAAEITPLNDSTVTLPAKLGSMPQPPSAQSSRLTPGATFGRPVAPQNTPEAAASSPQSKEENPEDNPFWSPDDSTPAADDKASPAALPKQEVPQNSPPMQNSSENPFGNKNPQPSREPAEGNPAPGGSVPQGFSAPTSGAVPAGAGGNPFAKEEIPTPKQPPVSEENPFVSDEGFSSLFSRKAEEDAQIPFPSGGATASPEKNTGDEPGSWGNLFSNDPAQAPQEVPGAGPPGMGNMMSGPAQPAQNPSAQTPPNTASQQYETIADDEDYGDFLPPVANVPLPAVFDTPEYASEPEVEEESEPVFGEDPNPFADFAIQPTAEEPVQAHPAAEQSTPPTSPSASPGQPGGNGFDQLAPLGGFQPTERPVPTPVSPGNGVSHGSTAPPRRNPEPQASSPAVGAPLQQKSPSPAGESKKEPPAPEPVREAPPEPKVEPEIGPAVSPPVSEEPPAQPVPVSAGPSAMGLPMVDDTGEIRDIELRAIFSTSEDFTMRKVARRVVTLPGITSCALATPGKLVQASRTEESRIGDEAREMVTTIRSLAKLTGMPEARCFTLHTDKGIVSIFLEGECCVTVHHESTSFGPGVREKLILIARSLDKLEE